MSCIVRLTSTGEAVDVATERGAKKFLEQPTGTDGFNFFSTDLKTANVIRKRERKKGKLNNTDRLTLRDIYRKVTKVAAAGESEMFREKVPKRELEAVLNHAVEILRQITNDRKWINTGSLLQHDNYLMESLPCLFMHPTAAVLIMGEIKVLETISEMMSKLEKPASVEHANNVISIVETTYGSCRSGFDKKWKAEKTFKKLESTGIMEHYLRCAAIEGSVLDTTVSPAFKDLLACTAYVQKSFKEGTPCGDTVRAILKGTEGHPPSARMLPYINTLILVSSAAPADDASDKVQFCHFCRKHGSDESLKCCSKCGEAVYCSRECQLADWKVHKQFCYPVSRTSHRNADASRRLVTDFIVNNSVNIMLRMLEECDKAGLNFGEMVVELDVSPDSRGIIPLIQDPPEFQIVPVAKYLDGTRFKEPSYVISRKRFADDNERKQYDKEFLIVLKHELSRRKSNQLLCVVSHDGGFTLEVFSRSDKRSEKDYFSQEAVEAYRSVIVDNDVSLLWKIFTTENTRQFLIFHLNKHSNLDSDTFIYPRTDKEGLMDKVDRIIEDNDFDALASMFGEEKARVFLTPDPPLPAVGLEEGSDVVKEE